MKMTEQQRRISKQILEVLYLLDGGQIGEQTLHAEVNLRLVPNTTRAEFDDALDACDRAGWLTGISPRFGGSPLWTINDAGLAARMQMR